MDARRGPGFFAEWREQAGAEDRSNGTHEGAQQRPIRTRRRHLVIAGIATAGLAAGIVAVVHPSAPAAADPSASDWYRLRMCESSDNYSINTGNDHYGAYQFDLPTWQSVGGSGYPNEASPGEQDARALILYRERGWQPWQCASILGLREDSDARSGRISDIHVPGSGSHRGVPAFPGARSYHYGDRNETIKRFQNKMHRRGYFPPGTGQFGPLTLRMVKRLQRLNGLQGSGLLGPKTWALAWTGEYSRPSAGRSSGRHVPAFPGSHPYRYGQDSSAIKRFQDRMWHRGFLPPGTGHFGPLTKSLVKRLQSLNQLSVNGRLNAATWRAAWRGRYSYPTSARAVPAFPGTRWYHYGDDNVVIKHFQDQMHARGSFPAGTGRYGPLTRKMVKRLQRRNHLAPTGEIGPKTWALAWTGRF